MPPPGVSGSPENIEQALALVNALPKPTSISCFVESLDRPLRVYASSGDISAQPAQGERSPRLFLFSPSGSFLMTIVADGPGANLLEFGELGTDKHSVKAEIGFPVEAPLAPEAPFARVTLPGGKTTSCGMCHVDERPVSTIGTAQRFSSQALRPVTTERVPLDKVRQQAESCDPSAEPGRCAILQSLFSYGDVGDAEFPADLPTIMD